MLNCLRLLFPKGTQWVCGEVNEIGVGFQQWSVAGSKMRNEDRVRTDANDFAILRPGEPAIHLCRPLICRRWIKRYLADEGSPLRVGDGPRRDAGGCSGCFGFSVCELVTTVSFVP